MNLDEQLRAALSQEAEMTNATRPPDIDGMIGGGKTRRRRRNIGLMGGVAAAAVLVGAGAYGIAQVGGDGGDSKTASEPTESTSDPARSEPQRYFDLDGADLAPGTYRKVVDFAEAGPVEADITFEGPGWSSGSQPIVWDGEHWAGLAVYAPHSLASGAGCMSDQQNQNVASSPSRLAAQLARLPQSEVVRPPASTEAFGLDAVHLRVRIDHRCPADDGYVLAETMAGSHGINYSNVPRPVVIDFWVVGVDGTPVVVEVFRDVDTPEEILQRATDARESVTFVTEEQE